MQLPHHNIHVKFSLFFTHLFITYILQIVNLLVLIKKYIITIFMQVINCVIFFKISVFCLDECIYYHDKYVKCYLFYYLDFFSTNYLLSCLDKLDKLLVIFIQHYIDDWRNLSQMSGWCVNVLSNNQRLSNLS